jgi:hypothetical protein
VYRPTFPPDFQSTIPPTATQPPFGVPIPYSGNLFDSDGSHFMDLIGSMSQPNQQLLLQQQLLQQQQHQRRQQEEELQRQHQQQQLEEEEE